MGAEKITQEIREAFAELIYERMCKGVFENYIEWWDLHPNAREVYRNHADGFVIKLKNRGDIKILDRAGLPLNPYRDVSFIEAVRYDEGKMATLDSLKDFTV